jgi:acyl carrier protein
LTRLPIRDLVATPDRDQLIGAMREELRRISPQLPADWPASALYRSDLDLDSLDLVELVARIEQHYGLLIPDSDLACFVSLEATADYVIAKTSP